VPCFPRLPPRLCPSVLPLCASLRRRHTFLLLSDGSSAEWPCPGFLFFLLPMADLLKSSFGCTSAVGSPFCSDTQFMMFFDLIAGLTFPSNNGAQIQTVLPLTSICAPPPPPPRNNNKPPPPKHPPPSPFPALVYKSEFRMLFRNIAGSFFSRPNALTDCLTSFFPPYNIFSHFFVLSISASLPLFVYERTFIPNKSSEDIPPFD